MSLTIKRELLPVGLNHGSSRPDGWSPDTIVIHVTEGSAASVRSWFNNPAADVSSNYMITVGGDTVMFVEESAWAQAQGIKDRPTAAVVLARPHVNPNDYCISIEHEGDGTKPLTAPQKAASVALIRDICARRNIPIDRRHIIGHHEIRRSKPCPGAIDVDELVRLAADQQPQPAPVLTAKPEVVWSNNIGDWLIVLRVESDTRWYYQRAKSLRAGTNQILATVPLSRMPRERPPTS